MSFIEEYGDLVGFIANITTVLGFLGIGILGKFLYSKLLSGKKTKVVIIQSKRFGASIGEDEIDNAIKPDKKFEEILKFEYDGEKGDGTSIKSFFESNLYKIEEIKEKYLNISIFGISEMPILVYFGYLIGDVTKINLYRSLRSLKYNNWLRASFRRISTWNMLFKNIFSRKKISIKLPELEFGEEINLFVEMSHKIALDCIPSELENNKGVSIELNMINRECLVSKRDLNYFRNKIEPVIKKIDEKIGPNGKVNLFLTVPTAIAILIGQSIHKNGPKYYVYDLSSDMKYEETLKLNCNN